MQLNTIAQQMHIQAARTGTAKRRLSRGLALSLKRIDGQCTLSAGRQDAYPSTDEALIIAQTFNVPPGTDPEWRHISKPTQDGGRIHWYIITWTWRESPHQPQLIGDTPKPDQHTKPRDARHSGGRGFASLSS